MLRCVLATTAALLAGVARADACPPAVVLEGDADVVAVIERELATRGIGTRTEGECTALRARIERRESEIVIVIVDRNGASSERAVSEATTAATVIESFARTDVASPLLATRVVAPPPPSPPYEDAALPRPSSTSVQLAAAFESSFANDGTTWVGGSMKLCIRVGPICAASRLRKSHVVEGLATSNRDLVELLVGVDVPIALGRVVLAPGFAGGFGGMDTYVAGMKRETGAFRGEAHVAVWVPLAFNLAFEASLGAGLGQQTDFDRSLVMAPDEPWGALRAGIGLRYGSR